MPEPESLSGTEWFGADLHHPHRCPSLSEGCAAEARTLLTKETTSPSFATCADPSRASLPKYSGRTTTGSQHPIAALLVGRRRLSVLTWMPS